MPGGIEHHPPAFWERLNLREHRAQSQRGLRRLVEIIDGEIKVDLFGNAGYSVVLLALGLLGHAPDSAFVSVEERRHLRAAVYQADGHGVLAALQGLDLSRFLQLAGDGLLTALAQEVREAEPVARACVAGLRSRGWDGDEELASELEGAIAGTVTSALPTVPVDLDDVSELLEGGLGLDGGRLDLATGDVRYVGGLDDDDELDDDDVSGDEDGRWLWMNPAGSDEGYRDMAAFIAGLEAPGAADRLRIAIDGKGEFRRFKDTVARWPEVEDAWYRFSDERRRGRARAWLAHAGYRPAVLTKPRYQP